MKKTYFNLQFKIVFIFLVSILGNEMQAQNKVTIADTAFARHLREQFPTCINGNQLDIACAKTIEKDSSRVMSIFNSNIVSLEGLQYFENLRVISITDNKKLKFLPSLNLSDLTYFNFSGNEFDTFPVLNFPNLQYFICANNKLTTLSNLNFPVLTYLNCSNNSLTSITLNYPKLIYLECAYNQLTSLPSLPNTLMSLDCSYNQLTSLPELPSEMNYTLNCAHNKIECFPAFPPNISKIGIDTNLFTCLPNYISAMDTQTKSYPLCKNNDPVNNPNNCQQMQEIQGYVYPDLNSNCKMDIGENPAANALVKLYNQSNILIRQTITQKDGMYRLVVPGQQYKVVLETQGMPFMPSCKADTTIAKDSFLLIKNVNFGIKCKSVDVGVQSIFTTGIVFPGRTHSITTLAGDIAKLYNLNCATGINGKVEIKVEGPITFLSNIGNHTPVVTGNIYTYTIPDFSKINMTNDVFVLNFKTDTTAKAGDEICVTVHVVANGDMNMSNNDKKICYKVVNSYDPNIKEVFPLGDVEEDYNDWFTYTIHFQNTGNAAAFTIKLTDELDSNLDLETFQMLNASHYNEVNLIQTKLQIKFPDIQLIDSATNPEKSKGFFQYRIRPKNNLKEGTVIRNTAYIYFDYNAPIITNTTSNYFKKDVSVEENNQMSNVVVFPNPSAGSYYLQLEENTQASTIRISVYNVLGNVVWSEQATAQTTFIDISNQPAGVYFIKIVGKKNYSQLLIKQ